ncbi:MAG: division/cell wall cluster transcriptional repressor MraZ [Fretibacterium sp.]|nr:division/cell wall cluster transcriptional repressor MraZ [Fretibacterium sp.]
MLMGTFEHRLDSKARLVLPAKFREKLGEVVVASIGMEQCVSLYSMDEWLAFVVWLKSPSFLTNEKTRRLQRLILASAHDLPIDGAGRVLLPSVLREYALLTQDVVVNGVNDHAEVWDRGRWASYWKMGLDMLPELTGGSEEA